MLWGFVIIGLVTLSSALYGLIVVNSPRGPGRICHVVSLALLASAWLAQHTTPLGWAALLAALVVELVVRTASRTVPAPVQAAEETPAISPPPSRPLSPEVEPPPKIVVTFGPEVETIALLRSAWGASGEVFLASLRRGGQRDAKLAEASSDPDAIGLEVGAFRVDLCPVGAPIDRATADYATGQTWDWPEAAAIAAEHASHVVVATQSPIGTTCGEIVGLHYRAHAALAEFSPLLSVVWPKAGRMLGPAALAALGASRGNAEVLRSCVSFRTFPLSEPVGHFLCDTAGLFAFGLPDLQMTMAGEPGEQASAILYRLAEEFFVSGRALEDGATVKSVEGQRWRARPARSRFPPDRAVIELIELDDSA